MRNHFLAGLITFLIPIVGQAAYAELDATYNYASVNGYAQIPLGGAVQSASTKRPNFTELGITTDHYPEIRFAIGNHEHEIGYRYKNLCLHSDTIIDDNLVVQGISFPIGSVFHAKFHYDIHQLYYAKTFQSNTDLSITPSIQGVLTRFWFDYNQYSRHFNMINGQLGLALNYPFHPNFVSTISGTLSLPFGHLEANEIKAQLSFPLSNKAVRIIPYFGVGWEIINFKDDKGEMGGPEHIQYIAQPFIQLGFRSRLNS